MKFLKFLIPLICLGCATAYVQYDYDKKIDFNTYKTYQFDLDQSGGLSEFDERRLIRYADSLLQIHGLKPSQNPDLFVGYNAEEYERTSGNNIGVGVGGTGGNVGVGVSGGIPIGGRSINRRLVLSLIDASKNTLIWEADSDSRIKEKTTPDQRNAYFKNLTEKIFKKFPLKSKTKKI